MAVTLLANLPKSFVRDMLVLDFLFGGEFRLSYDLEERFFFDPLDGPTFFEIRRACGAKPLVRAYDPDRGCSPVA